MSSLNEKINVLQKRKNLQLLLDYCIDNKLEFTVKSKPLTNDEFEVALTFDDLKKAIAFGVFVKENRIEIPGVFEAQKPVKKSNGKVDESAPLAEIKPIEAEEQNELEAEATEGTPAQDMFQSNANSLGI